MQHVRVLNKSQLGGVLLGIATQVLFLATVWQLFSFLHATPRRYTPDFLWRDCLLAIQFAVWHSLLLYPAVRRSLERWIFPAFYGLFYCIVTCLSLLAMFHYWQASPFVIWECTGAGKLLMRLGFLGSWGSLLYSLSLTGLGYQTGLTPWWYWVRGIELPRREFKPRGAYLWMRHPVYLSFLGLIWFTPRMSLDHMVLTGLWTIYIFVGSYLKDERLAYYMGKQYRLYQSAVPGYPGIELGPMGRRAA